MTSLNRSIIRILSKLGIKQETPPSDSNSWSEFLVKTSQLIDEERTRKEICENTLSVSVAEMEKLYAELKAKSESKLAKSEALFRTLFTTCPIPLMLYGENGILDCNAATLRILKCTNKNDLLSKHPATFSPEFQPDGTSSAEKAAAMDLLTYEKGIHQFEWEHRALDQTYLPVEVTLAPVQINGSNYIMALWRDLIEEKKRKQELIQSSKLASLGEMSAGIAHEINNPLTVIMATLPLLTMLKDDEDQFDSKIAIMQKSTDRIAKISKGLKKFSRSSMNKSRKAEIISDIISEALVITSVKSKVNSTKVETKIDSVSCVYCDGIEIEQVLVNLINNGIDAIKNNSEKWIQVHVFNDSKQVVVQVIDSGNGISPELEEKLFQPFFTTKPVGEGTGLGLSIAKGIIEDHHGTLKINRGMSHTCFEVRLPIFQHGQHGQE